MKGGGSDVKMENGMIDSPGNAQLKRMVGLGAKTFIDTNVRIKPRAPLYSRNTRADWIFDLFNKVQATLAKNHASKSNS